MTRPPRKNKLNKPAAVQSKQEIQLFDKVALDILHDSRHVFDGLSDEERNVVLHWMSDAIADGTGDNGAYSVLWELDYLRKPVSIDEFIDNPEYLGRVVGGGAVYAPWREDFRHVFRVGSPIVEWIMTGAIGAGKTTISVVALLYKLYQLSCLRDPHRYYGVIPSDLITFGIYSLTKKQVNDAGYHKARSYLDVSPYFTTVYPRDRKIDSSVNFLRNPVHLIAGSTQLHAIGLNLFSVIVDEMNFMAVKRDAETGRQIGQAYQLYNSTYKRIVSRYMRPGGSIPCLMMLVSSKNSQTSFVEERMAVSRASPHTFISDRSLWEMKPGNYSGKTFPVLVGSRERRSRILKPTDTPPTDTRVIHAPVEHRKEFEEDTDGALRDIAGVATFNTSPLIYDRESIFDCTQGNNLPNPFGGRDLLIISTDSDAKVQDSFELNSLCYIKESRWTPRLHPEAPRYLHIDIGLTGDALGFAMGHPVGMVRMRREDLVDGTVDDDVVPYVALDLMIAMKSNAGAQVDLSRIRSFIRYLSKIFRIARVTYDGYQSADSVQILEKAKIRAEVLSVDRTPDAYLSLRSAHSERRVAMYDYPRYTREILDLQRDGETRKINHPDKASDGSIGSKDVSDAVAGVVYGCLNDEEALRYAQRTIIDITKPVIAGDNAKAPTTQMPSQVAASVRLTAPVNPDTPPNLAKMGVKWDELADRAS